MKKTTVILTLIIILLMTSVNAITWEASNSPILNWRSLDMSTDGKYLVAGAYSENIYISNDYGNTWNKTNSPIRNWYGVCTAQNNTLLIAAATSSSYIYVSNDGGNTWTEHTEVGANGYDSLDCSDDGKYALATGGGSDAMLSNDSGNTWTAKAITTNDGPVAVSSTGQYMTVSKLTDGIYTSQDYGNTWTQTSIDTNFDDAYTTISNNGSLMIAGSVNSHVFKSTDYGSTWNDIGTLAGLGLGYAIGGTGDLSTVMIANYQGGIYESTNYGINWTENTQPLIDNDIRSGIKASTTGSYWAMLGTWSTTEPIYLNVKCEENWVYSITSCINNSQTIIYTDTNNCGTSNELPLDNGTAIFCSTGGGVNWDDWEDDEIIETPTIIIPEEDPFINFKGLYEDLTILFQKLFEGKVTKEEIKEVKNYYFEILILIVGFALIILLATTNNKNNKKTKRKK